MVCKVDREVGKVGLGEHVGPGLSMTTRKTWLNPALR